MIVRIGSIWTGVANSRPGESVRCVIDPSLDYLLNISWSSPEAWWWTNHLIKVWWPRSLCFSLFSSPFSSSFLLCLTNIHYSTHVKGHVVCKLATLVASKKWYLLDSLGMRMSCTKWKLIYDTKKVQKHGDDMTDALENSSNVFLFKCFITSILMLLASK